MSKNLIYFFCNSGLDKDVFDGSSSIFTGLINHAPLDKVNISIFTTNISFAVLQKRLNLRNIRIFQKINIKNKSNALFSYCQIILNFFFKNPDKQVLEKDIKRNNKVYLISGSDFWPDSIPAIYYKLKYQEKIVWIASFFLFAPKPWNKNFPYKGLRKVIGLFYWLSQLPIYFLIKKYADYVLVTSEPDVEKFVTNKRPKSKIIVIEGGVDNSLSEKFLKSNIKMTKEYDACFVGRLHDQKGVLELIDIWKNVCRKKPAAKLAIIGIGPLTEKIKDKIMSMKMNDNINLLGFLDGEKKYDIFKKSKLIVHPAIYDSGGMSAAEGMAWGLPAVGFDLGSLKTYYPKGMIKTPVGRIDKFAKNILLLLNDQNVYQKLSREALSLVRNKWNWNTKAEIFYQIILN